MYGEGRRCKEREGGKERGGIVKRGRRCKEI